VEQRLSPSHGQPHRMRSQSKDAVQTAIRGQIKPRERAGLDHIHDIRRALHPQMKRLWDYDPLSRNRSWLQEPRADYVDYAILERAGDAVFAPLISKRNDLICELEITFLRQQAAGLLIGEGGDLDIRVKTLFDALRIPRPAEMQRLQPLEPKENPMFCLLQDDALITRVSIETDRLLKPAESGSCSPSSMSRSNPAGSRWATWAWGDVSLIRGMGRRMLSSFGSRSSPHRRSGGCHPVSPGGRGGALLCGGIPSTRRISR
jgi:hypothetical protein